jgi:hypothetical protein
MKRSIVPSRQCTGADIGQLFTTYAFPLFVKQCISSHQLRQHTKNQSSTSHEADGMLQEGPHHEGYDSYEDVEE